MVDKNLVKKNGFVEFTIDRTVFSYISNHKLLT